MRNIVVFSSFFVGCGPAAIPAESGPSTVGAAEVEVGDCEGSPYRVAADTGGDPAPWADVDPDGRIRVTFDDRTTDCCPNPAGTFSADGSEVVLDFVTHRFASTSGCDCGCVIDFVVTSEPFAPGEYVLEVIYDGSSEGTLDVVVP